MSDKPNIFIYEEQTFTVGQETFVDSTVENNNAVIFEDNEETGYFYAIDRNNNLDILDALHIYNVSDVIDKDKPSIVRILWTEDLKKAFLSINNYYHAVFDFDNKAGYCRTGFPSSNNKWTLISERHLTDDLIIELSKTSNN
ncbi:DUF2251 domain-containing protein [Cellulophaga sp. BC115SP]|uniref:DUF2251 domain-containing protein n=1 Tax=Cellulophaga sp. BC115SP TaxID=2683263 RepID=UPI0014136AEB|nr:DUF2251 domain-containing protein [Cellulophaga sp. BC115SP]NBB32084.1 DUF2251 domain-containing protein [Cellulophaga sp. BC115SP]